jgi:hypothetical protein
MISSEWLRWLNTGLNWPGWLIRNKRNELYLRTLHAKPISNRATASPMANGMASVSVAMRIRNGTRLCSPRTQPAWGATPRKQLKFEGLVDVIQMAQTYEMMANLWKKLACRDLCRAGCCLVKPADRQLDRAFKRCRGSSKPVQYSTIKGGLNAL